MFITAFFSTPTYPLPPLLSLLPLSALSPQAVAALQSAGAVANDNFRAAVVELLSKTAGSKAAKEVQTRGERVRQCCNNSGFLISWQIPSVKSGFCPLTRFPVLLSVCAFLPSTCSP